MEADMNNHRYILMLIIISGLGEYCSCLITCKSPSNRIVDWFILYKVPHTVNTEGSEYLYMDSNQTPPSFSNYSRDIQSTKANPVYETLLPLYKKSKMLGNYGMYNDQPPNKNAGQSYGHSKGVYAFGKEAGFWIISSIPKFPAAVPEEKNENVDASYRYNDGQTKFGQIVFCVTLKPEYMETLDLYRDLIRGNLKDSLYVQTWRPKLNSSTDKLKFQVTNVENVCFENGMTYKTSHDHSKWAVAENEPWTCIGDINRDETQFKRGGLALCLNNAKVAAEFRDLVLEESRCKGKMEGKSTQKTSHADIENRRKKISKNKSKQKPSRSIKDEI